MNSPEFLLEAHELERRWGRVRAVNGISLSLHAGELLLLLGPNGAGKSTLLRLLAGLIRPQRGHVNVQGRRLSRGNPEAHRPIGLLSHQSLLYHDLTVLENLLLAARLYGLPTPRDEVGAALESAGLAARAGDRVGGLSRGLIQRAAIARALLHRPLVLLLDEPFTGLDADSVSRFRAQLAAQNLARLAVVLVTHHPAEAWDLATRVGVVVGGKLALDLPRPADLAGFELRYREVVGG